MGTTFSGRPSNLIGTAAEVNLTNRTSRNWRSVSMFLDFHPTTMASAPFVTPHSVASLFLIITGIPRQSLSLPALCCVLLGGNAHISSCKPAGNIFVLRRGSSASTFLRLVLLGSPYLSITIPEFTKERYLSRVAKARALVPLREKFAHFLFSSYLFFYFIFHLLCYISVSHKVCSFQWCQKVYMLYWEIKIGSQNGDSEWLCKIQPYLRVQNL